MAKRLLVLNVMLFALALSLAFAQSGSGHTKLPVGNFGTASILPTGQVITPTDAPGSTIQCFPRDYVPTAMPTQPKLSTRH